MANTLKFGNGEWYGKKDTILAYNDENNNYKPLPFDFSRGSSATVINKDGLIETVGSGEPRVDYKDSTKGAMLLEPSRSNLVTQSQEFESYWIKTNITANDNNVISPDGTTNACILTDNSTDGYHNINRIDIAPSDSNNYTRSFYVKKGTARYVVISARQISSSSSTSWIYDFDINNWTLTASSGVGQSIEVLKNGWIRLTVTIISNSNFNNDISIGISNGANISDTSYIGSGNTLYVWGAQLEQGSYPTSYIPTQGGVVTRLAESCNNGGNDQVINSTEGVLYAWLSDIKSQDFDSIIINNGIADENNQVRIWFYNNTITYQYKVGSDVSAQITTSAMDLTLDAKIACSWKLNEFKLFVNGSKINQDLSGNVLANNTLESVEFKRGNNTGNFYGKTKELQVFTTALSDEELEKLTTI